MLTENITDYLFSHWQHTLQLFGVDQITANQAFDNLVSVYSSPNRYYHTLQHIHSVLNTIETFKTHVQDLPSVQLAAWFHDVIYDTHAPDNEEKSADYAANMLKTLAIPATNIIQINRLILCTKNHQADDIDGQVLLDADLAILAATPIQYQEYAQAIRQEYAWVSETEYITGRGKVLEHFLQRPSIYLTPLMLESAEELARFNIKTELKFLQKNIGFI
ncbi:hypothetical protein VB713_00035 [Anabaena cylindrica UHCC 0172]|uniref:HD domain-containing protein n=1 Tax=Anabaena cylindrica TaxID=1165 RepID=UPI002B210CBA|nr:hypothetical protein [Anabaena cylindrica]MEA5549380.1 hypothetical protein [Anabaena cylindrica UHCC 0172]